MTQTTPQRVASYLVEWIRDELPDELDSVLERVSEGHVRDEVITGVLKSDPRTKDWPKLHDRTHLKGTWLGDPSAPGLASSLLNEFTDWNMAMAEALEELGVGGTLGPDDLHLMNEAHEIVLSVLFAASLKRGGAVSSHRAVQNILDDEGARKLLGLENTDA